MRLHTNANAKSSSTFKTLEDRLHAVHNYKYLYSLALYKTSKSKALIVCPIHGVFVQSFDKHLQGRGCPKCANKARGDCKRSNTTKFITNAISVHGNKYDYTNTVYGRIANSSVDIVCKVHGKFSQTANAHLSGHGCDKCAELIRRKNYLDEPTILYYLYFTISKLYKIGITVERRGIKHRYCADKEPYEVLFSKIYQTGEEAYNTEQTILKANTDFKYLGPDILVGGNSELFNYDILKGQYDKNEQHFKDADNW